MRVRGLEWFGEYTYLVSKHFLIMNVDYISDLIYSLRFGGQVTSHRIWFILFSSHNIV
jgi:hypothetical protein